MSSFVVPAGLPSHHLAVIGLAGRFPGAPGVEELWRLLLEGREAVSRFPRAELDDPSVSDEELASGSYVPARGVLAGADLFDAAFFGYAAREAEVLDPQQRIFLECAFEAIENAGYDPLTLPGLAGVYAGTGMSTYAALYLLPDAALVRQLGAYQLLLGNDKDFLATNVSYRLNLRGPSAAVQTACSTSLVAVHFAALALASFDCDLALAGGVSIQFPQQRGYRYEEGGILAKDGHCRPFDREATGMVGGSGAGVVVLKRLADALADGDPIRAVILGTAVNNDGRAKVGFTAPSAQGQAEVIAAAQAIAGVSPRSIGFVEAHGTATPLGDPIEVEALKRVWAAAGEAEGGPKTVLGSLKSNLGHLDAAAGVTGLIKAVLALERETIPPTLHFRAPNPRLGLRESPFWVNATATPWPRRAGAEPRRAGVSSFGIGGTNAHAVIEEAPALEASGPSRPLHLLLLSARSEAALAARRQALAAHLAAAPDLCLADVAHTLAVGRHGFNHRLALLGRDGAELVAALAGEAPEHCLEGVAETRERPVAFLLPGQGTQSVGMGRAVLHAEPVFRAALERCARPLTPVLGLDLLRLFDPPAGDEAAAAEHLADTRIAQPAIFAVSFALAELLASWGVRPAALLGHSLGEYVAATLAGVFALEDALRLVAARGRLMATLPEGAMLAVPLPVAELLPLLDSELELAAENAPGLSTITGPAAAISALAARLASRGVACRRLATRHAFHSRAMDAVLEPFAAELSTVALHPPLLPYVSNLTGTWVSAEQATDQAAWLRQLREPVRFAAGLRTLSTGTAAAGAVLVEVGPGRSLSSLAAQQGGNAPPAVVATLPTSRQGVGAGASLRALYRAVAELWLAGVEIDHRGFYAPEKRRRLVLPTYPFERQRYWVGAPPAATDVATLPPASAGRHPRQHSRVPYVAPRQGLEQEIATIWGELLGVDEVGRHDDFFALGGHSLAALRLAGELSERLGLRLAAAAITEAPTVAALVERLGASATVGPPLVRLADTTAGRPFFLVHPIGGGVFAYRTLAERLAPLGPVYGFEAPSFAGAEPPARRLEPLAARYLAALRAVQPRGPYRLGGWSFGGLVAFAMAAQLAREGEEVELLTLIDSWPTHQLPAPREGELRQILTRDRASGGAESARLLAQLQAHAEAAGAYVPTPLSIPVLLVLASGTGAEPEAARRLWHPYLEGPVREHRIPADHYSLLVPPAVDALAAALADGFEWARSKEMTQCKPAMT